MVICALKGLSADSLALVIVTRVVFFFQLVASALDPFTFHFEFSPAVMRLSFVAIVLNKPVLALLQFELLWAHEWSVFPFDAYFIIVGLAWFFIIRAA